MMRDNKNVFAERGLNPSQLDVLVFIFRQKQKGENVSQRDIEKRLNIRPSSVSCLIGNLESKGLLTRTVGDSDARIKHLILTPEGETLVLKNKQLMLKCDGIIESAITPEEQEKLSELLEKIISFIENSEKEEQNV